MKVTTALILASLFVAPAAMADTNYKRKAVNKVADSIRTTHKPVFETTEIHVSGREDLVFEISRSWQQTIDFYQNAHKYKKRMSKGVRCIGWMIVPHTDTATFTLTSGGRLFTAIAKPSPDGTVMTLVGTTYFDDEDLRRDRPRVRRGARRVTR